MTTSTKKESAAGAAALAGNHGFSLISHKKLIQLYTLMVNCRMLEERALDLSAQDKLNGNSHAVTGWEAAAVGAAIDLLPEDTFVSSERDFIAGIINGAPLTSIIGDLSSSISKPIPNGQFDLATGAAMANKKKKNGKIAVTFSSQDSTSLGSLHEAIATAGAHQLPMLFVCHSSPSAASQSLNKFETITLKAQAAGFPGIPVDGSDVVAVYRVATEAISHARNGNGPTLIDCVTCSSEGHPEIDPILKMETYLSRKGLFSQELKFEVTAAFSKQLAAAIEA